MSRIDSSFNFGLTIDNIILSSTNNKFDRVFIDIEEKGLIDYQRFVAVLTGPAASSLTNNARPFFTSTATAALCWAMKICADYSFTWVQEWKITPILYFSWQKAARDTSRPTAWAKDWTDLNDSITYTSVNMKKSISQNIGIELCEKKIELVVDEK